MENKLILSISFSLVFFILLAGYASALSCLGYSYGDVTLVSGVSSYCDVSTGNFIAQKIDGNSCVNDFECSSGFCLSDICTDASSILQDYSWLLLSDICPSNLTSAGCINMTDYPLLIDGTNISATCNPGYSCFICDANHFWNSTLGNCQLDECSSIAGQRCVSGIPGNSSAVAGACLSGSCYSCNSGYSWNVSANPITCSVNPSTPGPGPGPGPSGGSSTTPSGGYGSCATTWTCSAWSACTQSGIQARTCRKLRINCNAPTKPAEIQHCQYSGQNQTQPTTPLPTKKSYTWIIWLLLVLILLLAAVIALVWYYLWRKKQNQTEEPQENN